MIQQVYPARFPGDPTSF